MTDTLAVLIAEELAEPVTPSIAVLAEHCRRRHERAALAVLFYGSCLWLPPGSSEDALADFYLIVDRYEAAYPGKALALANHLLPPNVFYVEHDIEGRPWRAKYAVISLDHFRAACRPEAAGVAIWARFSQPARLVWARDAAMRETLAHILATACRTMLASARPLAPPEVAADVLWQLGFAATYAAELRPESAERALAIFAAAPERYRRIAALALPALLSPPPDRAAAIAFWRRRRRLGRLLNALRLVKAMFTFQGALDYAAWKVRRHSGMAVAVSDWQRRHPLLAAPLLGWRFLRALRGKRAG